MCYYAKVYVMKYNILRKTNLTIIETEVLFDIIKDNLLSLEYKISNNDKELWIENLKNSLQKEKFYLYLVYKEEKIVGFVEITEENNKLTLSEIQIDNYNKKTRILLDIINFLLTRKDFLTFDEMAFYINKQNAMSNKTFSHLGGQIIEERQKSYLYKIKRCDVEKYLKSITK